MCVQVCVQQAGMTVQFGRPSPEENPVTRRVWEQRCWLWVCMLGKGEPLGKV